MRTLKVLIALLLLPAWSAHAQETDPPEGTRISGAQVSGVDLDRLSPGLQADIGKLVGAPLNRRQLGDLAARIEAEQPRFVAAIRAVPDSEGGARVVFVVARIREQDQEANINAKYIVEDAEVRGVPDRDLTSQMQSDLQALTGKPLDVEAAERLAEQLRAAFPNYDVTRRMRRGSQAGRLRLIYELRRSEWSRWLRFEPLTPNPSVAYHSDQGWGVFMPVGLSARDTRVMPLFAFGHTDELIDEISGFGIRAESRRLGTERLGMSFEWTNYDADWREPTVTTIATRPELPGLYRNRSTVTPLVRFAITPRVTVAGGVSITELDSLNKDPLTEEALLDVLPSRMANAFVGSVSFVLLSRGEGRRHDLGAAFSVRAGSESLQSDLVYTRYAGSANYLYRWGRQSVLVSAMAGGTSGDAPLFERFTLGDAATLRGWDKYDISPVGGSRMVHLSTEYRNRGLAIFIDSGSAWDRGAERRFRVSAGLGLHTGPFFATVGVPLNTDELRAVFTTGFRFSFNAERAQ
jgi:hypothetical protein